MAKVYLTSVGDVNNRISQHNTNNGAHGDTFVKVPPQTLIDAEKAQARDNIGLGNVDNTSDIDKPISTAQQAALNGKTNKADFEQLANVYDPTATYAVGDLCIYDNVIYKCKTAITTPEAFDSSKWEYFKLYGVSNPNLLDNPWFTVNQRENTVYENSSNSAKYCLDRWNYRGCNLEILSDGCIKLTKTAELSVPMRLNQGFLTEESPLALGVGEKFTYSVWIQECHFSDDNSVMNLGMYQGNSAYVASYSIGEKSYVDIRNGDSGIFSVTFEANLQDYPYVNAGSYFGSSSAPDIEVGDYIIIKAIKLEEGSVSTLHLDFAPDYATELLKCQRYYIRLPGNNGTKHPLFGRTYSAKEALFAYHCPTEMRIVPSIVLSSGIRIRHGGSGETQTDNLTLTPGKMGNIITFDFTSTTSDFSVGDIISLRMSATQMIEIIADV